MKTLDNPARIFYIKANDFALVVLPVLLSLLFGYYLLAFFVIAIKLISNKFMGGEYIKLSHKAYWFLPHKRLFITDAEKKFPESHKRKILL